LDIKTKRIKEKITALTLGVFPTPKIKFYEFRIENKKILVVEVKKSKEICTFRNLAYIRVGTSKRVLTLTEIVARSVERVLITIDKSLTEVEEKEINEECIRIFSEGRVRRGLPPATLETLRRIGVVKEEITNII